MTRAVRAARVRGAATVLAAALVAAIAPGVAHATPWPAPRDGGRDPDTLRGTAKADYLRGHEGPDRISGKGGNDLLTGDTGSDRVDGGPGDDVLTGAAGGDRLSGDDGDDILLGGFGGDVLSGGAGNDTLDGANDVDYINGGPGDDLIHGGSAPDFIDAGPGDDRVFGDSGGGAIDAGPGDDVIVVDDQRFASSLRISCGAGDDILYLVETPGVSEEFTRGAAIARSAVGCEHVQLAPEVPDPNTGTKYLAPDAGGVKDGTAKDDLLLGGFGSDTLRGYSGNDVLWGQRVDSVAHGTTADVLDAGAGDDTIYGGPVSQKILAGSGDDFVNGGVGDNSITGGDGNDIIRLRGAGLSRVDAGRGADTIYASGPAIGYVRCGTGHDVVYANRNDKVADDCERVTFPGTSKPARWASPPTHRAQARADAAPGYADVIRATPGLTHYWRMDDTGSYSDTANTAPGAVGFAYAQGVKAEPGVTDDGDAAWKVRLGMSPGYADRPRGAEAPGTTFEAWVRTGPAPAPREVLVRDEQSGGDDPVRRIRINALDGGRFEAILASADTQVTLTSGPTADPVDSWHHVAFTRDGTTVRLYVDGTQADAAPDLPLTATSNTNGPWAIAGINPYGFTTLKVSGDDLPLSGALDEVAIYNRPLDAETVRAHARFGDDGVAPVTTATPAIPAFIGRRFETILSSQKAGTRYRCLVDGAAVEFVCPADLVIRLPVGPHTLRIRAVDRFGVSETAPVTASFTVDVEPPKSTLAVAKIGRTGDTQTVAAFASEDPGATFECRIREASDAAAFAPCRSPLVIAPPRSPSAIDVRAVDAAGNPAIASAHLALTAPAGLITVPAFVGFRSDIVVASAVSGASTLRCRTDAGPDEQCPSDFRLPVLGAGTHAVKVTELSADGVLGVTVPWTVVPERGPVQLAGVQFPAIVESAVQLGRRVPRVRFLLDGPAQVVLQVMDAAGRSVGAVKADGVTGANALKIPANALQRLKLGRYVLVVTARGTNPSGTPPVVQRLPFALIPRNR